MTKAQIKKLLVANNQYRPKSESVVRKGQRWDGDGGRCELCEEWIEKCRTGEDNLTPPPPEFYPSLWI